VARPRLDAPLSGVLDNQLTLVIAPAGSGKTQLLVDWMGKLTVPAAWVSLEEIDDDPFELWTAVIAAAEQLEPGCGAVAQELLVRRAPPGDVVRALLRALDTERAGPAGVLVVDDLHHVRSPPAVDSFADFVQHLPPWLHVVVAGRTEPRLPLDRLRVRGRLLEIRVAELRFTEAEAREVLLLMAPDLTDAEIEASASSTEGWAAGIQLIGLAARSAQLQAVQPLLRPDVQLRTEDYVLHEMLAVADPEVVDVLTRVSVVDRVNGQLAAAITARSDARHLLLRAEADGLFVSRLGAEDWFRIHPLVREVLHNQLEQRAEHRQCHERAASWLEQAGETVTALEQWLLAERPRDALRLLAATSTELYDQGREAAILRTIEAIPRSVAFTDVAALIDYSVSQILVSRERFVETVRDAAWHAERMPHELSARLDALQSVALTMSGDWTAGSAHARQALDGLGDAWWSDPAGRFVWNVMAREVALSESWDDDHPVVRDATIAMSRDPRRGISLEGVRALGYALAGRPVDALRIAAGIGHAAPTMSILRVELATAEAIARREIADRETAVAELRALADNPAEVMFYGPVAAMLVLGALAADDGDSAAAAEQLARTEEVIAARGGGRDLHDWVRRAATAVALAGGNVDQARLHASAYVDPFWGPICRARVALVTGDRPLALGELESAQPRCVRHQVILGLVSARAATATDDVVDRVTRAIEIASAHGMLQTVVSYGSELMDVIERAAWRVSDEWLHRLRLAMAPPADAVRLPTREFIEPLTDRERDVLRLLPSRLALSEIAKELYVSVNTLKFHLRIIYRKLGVNSREEAAAIARSMTRVSPTASR
jgi:LuxR family maltose regulon positive regulatory protein